MTFAWLPRIAGALTAGYGVAVAARPAVMLGPCGWSADDPALRAVARMTALRDVASGLALVAAPTPNALRLAIAARVLADLSDATILGIALRGRPQRGKAVAVAAGWGLLCGATAATVRS
ncbi:hypothetical protein ACFWF7_22830 [Nocardia sp. NPDC060256]|uniref:hypothetical protein n=1 Tax=unclassified Nocardia TaxID=2637762 RepID=UPI00364E7B40